MLSTFAPYLTKPLPCMAVAKFTPLSADLEPKGSLPPPTLSLRGASSRAGECTFSPAGASSGLWPLQLSCAWLDGSKAPAGFDEAIKDGESAFVLRLEHRTRKVSVGDPGELTVFISGSLGRSLAAVETLLTEVQGIRLVACDGSWERTIASDSLRVEGFAPSERVLPTDVAVHDGALAMEYLNYPRRFCFIRLSNLNCPQPTSAFYVVLQAPRSAGHALSAVEQSVHLNCLPIVNLYKAPPVALKLKGHRDDYLIARADSRHVHWDVYDVLRLRLSGPQATTDIPEFHAGLFSQLPTRKTPMWQGTRTERQSTSLAHSSLTIRLINIDSAAQRGEHFDLALLDLLCTNCDAPEFINTGAPLQIQRWECGYRASLEVAATKYVPPLSPSQLSVCETLGGLQAPPSNLRQLLKSYRRNDIEFSATLIARLGPVSSEVVAVAWPGLSHAAMVPAVRYRVDLREVGEDTSGMVLLGRVICKLLSQRHDHRMPMHVQLDLPGGRRVECAA
jgi:type VI protein secretion system component VasA